MRHFLTIICVFLSCSGNAQFLAANGDTIFNKTDKQGKKQGYWKVKYDDGVIKYTAFFKDDKPIGLMRRYFEDNSLKAEMYFNNDGIRSKAKIFYQAGPLAAEGNYINSLKDSTWNYYSYYTKTLSNRETYLNGKKHGRSTSYFSTGKISEELDWKNGVREGIWKLYFENGALKLATAFVNGKRTGEFVLNYPDNRPEWNGYYINDKREGKWSHFDVNQKDTTVIEYKNGIAINAAELEAKEQKLLKEIEKAKGKIPEPDETNFMPEKKESK